MSGMTAVLRFEKLTSGSQTAVKNDLTPKNLLKFSFLKFLSCEEYCWCENNTFQDSKIIIIVTSRDSTT